MLGFARTSMLDVWQAQLGIEELLPRFQGLLDAGKTPGIWHELTKAGAHDSFQPIDRLVESGPIETGSTETGSTESGPTESGPTESGPTESGPALSRPAQPRIAGDSVSVIPLEDVDGGLNPGAELALVRRIIRSYATSVQPELRHLLEHYGIDHVARKVVGVTGAGRDTWIVLMTDDVSSTPILLEVRQAEASVAERFLPKGAFSNHGQRVVYGQRLIQGDDDILLGWDRDAYQGAARDYYVRRLRDWRASADVAGATPAGIELWGRMCGWTLARAHARSSDRVAIASYLGKSSRFERAIVEYSRACADQNESDFAAMQKAVRKGSLPAETP